MHMIYHDTFADEQLKERLRSGKIRDRLDRKGYFCVTYELPRND